MRQDQVEPYETPWGTEYRCKKCGSDVFWQDCENCKEGFSGHDCGEDTCCCLYPEENIPCDICNGEGGWFVCLGCDTAKVKTDE